MLYILTINLLNTIQRVQITFAIIVAVSLGLAVLTIIRVLRGELVTGRADLSEVSVRDMNAQAAYFLPSAALLMVLFSHSTRPSHKLLLLLGWSVITLAIMATSSRGAIVSLAVILALGILVDRKLLQVVLPILAIGGIGAILLPAVFLDRLSSIVTFSDRGAGRLDIWMVTLQMIQARPILGVGLDSFGKGFDMYLSETPGIANDIGTGRGAHSLFLNAQGELGIIGLVLLVAFIGMTLKRGWAAIVNLRRADDLSASLATAVWLGLVGMLVMGLFMVVQYWKLFWLLLALPEVMRRLPAKATQEIITQ
jgi:O-antigen ligase